MSTGKKALSKRVHRKRNHRSGRHLTKLARVRGENVARGGKGNVLAWHEALHRVRRREESDAQPDAEKRACAGEMWQCGV